MKFPFLGKIDDNYQVHGKFHIGIVGSRSINDYKHLCKFLDHVLNDAMDQFNLIITDIVLVSGGAKGVDSMAERYADAKNIDIVVIKPDWKRNGRKAGPIRNTEIVKLSDYLVAVYDKDTGGTWDTITKAKRKGIPIKLIDYRTIEEPV